MKSYKGYQKNMTLFYEPSFLSKHGRESQYFTNTRPNIVSQFLHTPITTHWQN